MKQNFLLVAASVGGLLVLCSACSKMGSRAYVIDEAKVMVGSAVDEAKRKIILGDESTKTSKYLARVVFDAPIESGSISFESILSHADPDQIHFSIAGDEGPAVDVPLSELSAKIASDHIQVALPEALKGAYSLTMSFTADLDEPGIAAEIAIPELDVTLSGNSPESTAYFSVVDPWMEADVAQSKELWDRESARTQLVLSGPKNDWMTGAIMIKSNKVEGYTVSLNTNGSPALTDRLDLRIVGQVEDADGGTVVWDALMNEDHTQKYGHRPLNSASIQFYPHVLVSADTPVMLWLTVDVRGLDSGRYTAEIELKNAINSLRIPVEIRVGKAELPIDNPLMMFGWQWNNDDPELIKDMIDHGYNVFWREQEAAWKAGAKFLLFQFSPTFGREPLTEERKAEIREELEKIKELVTRLQIPDDAWAINIADEISDSQVDRDIESAQYIRSLWPEVKLYFNPAWGKAADALQNTTTLDGTIRKIAPFVDVWQPYSWHLWDGSGVYEYIRETGKTFWYYEIFSTAARRPNVAAHMLRTGPVYAWKFGATGYGNYALNSWWGAGDPWNHKTGPNYALVYSVDPIPPSSRAYEAGRQGVQEYKRFFVLEKKGYNPEKLKEWADVWYSEAIPGKVQKIEEAVKEMDTALEALAEKEVATETDKS